MSKTVINFWLDSALLVMFLVLLWSATIVRFVFPPGPDADGWLLWGGGYRAWSDFQFATLCVFALGVLIHVMLHWTWVCGVATTRFSRKPAGQRTKLDDGQRTIIGVGAMIVILNIMGIGIAAAVLMVQGPNL